VELAFEKQGRADTGDPAGSREQGSADARVCESTRAGGDLEERRSAFFSAVRATSFGKKGRDKRACAAAEAGAGGLRRRCAAAAGGAGWAGCLS